MFLAVRYVMRKRKENKNARIALKQQEAQSVGSREESIIRAPAIDKNTKASTKPFRPCVHMPSSRTTVVESVISEKIELPEAGRNRSGLTRKETIPIVRIEAPGVQPCQKCREERLAARNYRIKLIIGLFFPFAIQALDTTIVASALPWIASDFNKISQMNWIISAFNLCSAAFIPFWGQMADVFGRFVTMETTLLLMLLGSALCTGAPTSAFPMLILGRAIQGMSVAGINVVVRTILGDGVSLKEYAKNNSIFSIVAGVGYALGPVIGGYLTNSDWRWCFGINLPVAAIGIVLVFFVLRKIVLGPQPLPQVTEKYGQNPHRMQFFKAKVSTIDIGGQFLFLSGMSLLILALTWGGADYAWHSTHVLVPLIIGIILTLCFIYWEYMMVPGRGIARKFPLQHPTIPWNLLAQRNMGLLFYINFATGMAMAAVLYFVDIYFTIVKNNSPSQAGVQLLYYTPGIGVGVYAAMFMCNFWPRQTFTPLFLGSIIEAVGITVLTWALHQGHNATIYGMMALAGCGTGLRFMPGSLHGIAFFPNHIASVISMIAFAIPFGSTISMTLMNVIFNNQASLPSSVSASSTTSANSFGTIDSLPLDEEQKIRSMARDGVVWAFVSILPFMWLCVLAAGWLGNVRVTREYREDGEGGRDFGGNLVEGWYLLEVFRSWRKRRRERERGIYGV